MVAAELAPYARGTETADVVAGLSKALRQLGHRVTVAVPRYPGFEAGGLLLARRLTPLSLGTGELTLLDGQLPTGVELTLFDDPPLYDRASVFGDSEPFADNLVRCSVLSRAAAALAEQRSEQGKPFELVHAFDAPAAATLALVQGSPRLHLPTLLSVLDPAQGQRFAAGSPASVPGLESVSGGADSLLALGARAASAIVAGSEDVARDLASPELTGPLAAQLSGDRRVVTIGTGLDYSIYNPATDTALTARYDAEDPSNKGRCKAASLNELELELELDRPLLFAYAALPSDAELLLQSLPRMLKNDVAVAALVPESLASELDRLVAEYPADLARVKDGRETARRSLLSAADFALCLDHRAVTATLVQAAQRYGAVPIAAARGAFADVLVDCDAELETGTAFMFERMSSEDMLGAATRALGAYGSPGHARLRRRVMRADLSWDRIARRYVQMYRKALGAPQF